MYVENSGWMVIGLEFFSSSLSVMGWVLVEIIVVVVFCNKGVTHMIGWFIETINFPFLPQQKQMIFK